MTQRHIRAVLLVMLCTVAVLAVRQARAAAPVTPIRPPSRAISLSPIVVIAIAPPAAIAMPGDNARRSITPMTVRPRRFEGFVLPEALRDSIVLVALSQLGAPYVFGGTTPRDGFDCSGLVRYALARLHVSAPRRAFEQAEVGAPVERRELQRGDLLAFGVGGTVTHIGIYVGAGRFVHASSVAGKVILSALDRPPSPLIRPMRGARRLWATNSLPNGARSGG